MVVVVELLLPGVVVVLPGVVVDVLLPVVLSGVVVVVPTEPLAPGVPVVLLLPIPVVVSVVPLDGLLLWSVVLPGNERGLVVVELPLRGVVGLARPEGEVLPEVEVSLPTPVLLPGVVAPVVP